MTRLKCTLYTDTDSLYSLVDCVWTPWTTSRNTTRWISKNCAIHRYWCSCCCNSVLQYSRIRSTSSQIYDKGMARSYQRISQGTSHGTYTSHWSFWQVYSPKAPTLSTVSAAKGTQEKVSFRASLPNRKVSNSRKIKLSIALDQNILLWGTQQ